jgi:uncharacterized protein (DUF1330 family)
VAAKEIAVSAYLVFIRERTFNASEMEYYWANIRATFAGHEVRVLAAYGAHQDLEGSATEGTVIAQFPSMQAAKDWYDSPAYRKVRIHRQQDAVYRGILVQGLDAQ